MVWSLHKGSKNPSLGKHVLLKARAPIFRGSCWTVGTTYKPDGDKAHCHVCFVDSQGGVHKKEEFVGWCNLPS